MRYPFDKRSNHFERGKMVVQLPASSLIPIEDNCLISLNGYNTIHMYLYRGVFYLPLLTLFLQFENTVMPQTM